MKVKFGDIYRGQFLVGVIKFHVAFDLSVVQGHEESLAGNWMLWRKVWSIWKFFRENSVNLLRRDHMV